MPEVRAFTGVPSENDLYQGSENTNYIRDQTTGQLILKSGINTRCLIPEQFKSATLIIKDNNAVNAEGSVYIVPEGKVFIVLGANLQISTQGATFSNVGRLRFNLQGSAVSVLRGYGDGSDAVAYGMSQNFASLLVLVYGDSIVVQSDSLNLRATGAAFGYEIDSSEYFPA